MHMAAVIGALAAGMDGPRPVLPARPRFPTNPDHDKLVQARTKARKARKAGKKSNRK